jgi:hypothetical protein
MSVTQPNAFRRQDGQVVTAPAPGLDSHPQYRWRQRAPAEYRDRNVRSVWREADPLDAHWSGETYGRIHEPSGMLLIAEWGFITTVVRVAEAESEATQDVVAQYKEGMLDGE